MKGLAGIIVTLVLVVAFVWFVWTWGFCRFYVAPNYMAVITAKIGDPLPPDQILAKKGQKGVQEDVLGEGRHFLNPFLYEREIQPVIVVPPGKVGVVTSKVGADLPEGEFLAEKGQKGIWRNVLGPGKYRMNPLGYQVDVIDAISIPIGYAGVLTSLSGNQAPAGAFAGPNEKGVREHILQPGLYYVNPKEFKVDVLEIGVNQVSLLGQQGGEVITKGQLRMQNTAMEELQRNVLQEQKKKRFDYLSKSLDSFRLSRQASERQQPAANPSAAQTRQGVQRAPRQQEQMDLERVKQQYLQGGSMATLGLAEYVQFPSRDGFQISLDMTVEFELLPDRIAWIFSRYGDLPAVVDKIIMPQITSISRNKGSEYGAKDFIVGEGREKFQNDLTKALADTLGDKNILIHNALIRHVEVPTQILEPIQQASIAIQQDLTNKEKQNTTKRLAELNTETSLIDQRREQVMQETTKLKAEIKAEQEKKVAEIHAEALRQVAEIGKETAGIRADIVRQLGRAEAESVKMVQGEQAKGTQMKAAAFGDPNAYTLWTFANGLPGDLRIRIIHAGEGTLWTDLENARMGDLGGAANLKKGK